MSEQTTSKEKPNCPHGIDRSLGYCGQCADNEHNKKVVETLELRMRVTELEKDGIEVRRQRNDESRLRQAAERANVPPSYELELVALRHLASCVWGYRVEVDREVLYNDADMVESRELMFAALDAPAVGLRLDMGDAAPARCGIERSLMKTLQRSPRRVSGVEPSPHSTTGETK